MTDSPKRLIFISIWLLLCFLPALIKILLLDSHKDPGPANFDLIILFGWGIYLVCVRISCFLFFINLFLCFERPQWLKIHIVIIGLLLSFYPGGYYVGTKVVQKITLLPYLIKTPVTTIIQRPKRGHINAFSYNPENHLVSYVIYGNRSSPHVFSPIYIYNYLNQTLLHKFDTNEIGTVKKTEFSPDEKYLVSTHPDAIVFWDLSTRENHYKLLEIENKPFQRSQIRDSKFSSNGDYFAIKSNKTHIVNSPFKPESPKQVVESFGSGLAVGNDGTVASHLQGYIGIQNSKEWPNKILIFCKPGRVKNLYEGTIYSVKGLEIDSDARKLYVIFRHNYNKSQFIYKWNFDDGILMDRNKYYENITIQDTPPLSKHKLESKHIFSTVLNLSAHIMATSHPDKIIRLWNINTGAELDGFRGDKPIAFDLKNKSLYFRTITSEIAIYNIAKLLKRD